MRTSCESLGYIQTIFDLISIYLKNEKFKRLILKNQKILFKHENFWENLRKFSFEQIYGCWKIRYRKYQLLIN